MKLYRRLFLYLLVALSINSTSFAEAGEVIPDQVKIDTDLKTGEIIFIEDVKKPAKNAGSMKADEGPVEKPAENKEENTEEPNPSRESVEKIDEPVKPAENQSGSQAGSIPGEYKAPEKKAESTSEEKKPAEEATKPVENKKNTVHTGKTTENSTSKKSEEVKKMVSEIDRFIDQVNTSSSKTKSKDMKKNAELISDVINSDMLSKDQSEKIANATKDITETYKKKINQAQSQSEKEKLANEAMNKINKTVKDISKDAYSYINDNKDNISLDDQKNETLTLEIEADIDEDDDKDKKEAGPRLPEIKRKSQSEPAKSPQNPPKTKPSSQINLILIGIIILGIGLSLVFALKNQKKKLK